MDRSARSSRPRTSATDRTELSNAFAWSGLTLTGRPPNSSLIIHEYADDRVPKFLEDCATQTPASSRRALVGFALLLSHVAYPGRDQNRG